MNESVEYRVEWRLTEGAWRPWRNDVETDRQFADSECEFRLATRTVTYTDWTPTRGDIPPPPPKPPAGRPSTSASETKEGQRRPPPPAPPAGGPSTTAIEGREGKTRR